MTLLLFSAHMKHKAFNSVIFIHYITIIYSCNTAIVGGLPQIVAANILSNNSLNTKITDDVSSNCNQKWPHTET